MSTIERDMDPRTEAALSELKALVRRSYPSASFRVARGVDNPEAIHLITAVDTENTDDVLDVVLDRVLHLQIEDGLPIHVIPVRPVGQPESIPGKRGVRAAGRDT